MTNRILLLVPQGLTFDMLTEEQQTAINGVFGQYVLPMPSTIPHDGKVVLDGLAADNFDASHIPLLGLPFEVIAQWKDDGEVVIPLNEAVFLEHLPPSYTYDEEGNVIDTVPATLCEPHSWAGWNKVIGV